MLGEALLRPVKGRNTASSGIAAALRHSHSTFSRQFHLASARQKLRRLVVFVGSPLDRGILVPLALIASQLFTTFSDGCLGSNDDEGRSEVR